MLMCMFFFVLYLPKLRRTYFFPSLVFFFSGRHLFDRVLGPNGLLASKARLLCTNAIPFVEQADELLFLRKGVIIERGEYHHSLFV